MYMAVVRAFRAHNEVMPVHNSYNINVSVVSVDDLTATVVVSSDICQEETFKVNYNLSFDSRFCTFQDVENRVYEEFLANNINYPRQFICLSDDTQQLNFIDNTTLNSNTKFKSTRFDVPRTEYNTFKRTHYTFTAERNDESIK